jgi:hypothetical protein
MSRKPYLIPDRILKEMVEAVIVQSGFTADNNEGCLRLSDDIFMRTNEVISSRTLYRIFKRNSNHRLSKHTLDLLSKYCGYVGIADFIKNHESSVYKEDSFDITILKDIYSIHIKGKDLNYRDVALFAVSKNLVKKLRHNLSQYDLLAPHFSKDGLASKFFIEQFVDYDLLAHHYHIAIRIYIASHENKEAQVFGNCILFLRAYLMNNNEDAELHINEVNQFRREMNIHPFVSGRQFACNIIYKVKILEEDAQELIEEMFQFERFIPRSGDSYMNFPGFHFTLCDALIQCGKYSEAKKLCDIALREYPNAEKNIDTGFITSFQLFKAIVNFHIGNKKTFDKSLVKVKSSKFNFLSEKYFKIMLNNFLINNSLLDMREEKFARKNNQVLIKQTGFSRFRLDS